MEILKPHPDQLTQNLHINNNHYHATLPPHPSLNILIIQVCLLVIAGDKNNSHFGVSPSHTQTRATCYMNCLFYLHFGATFLGAWRRSSHLDFTKDASCTIQTRMLWVIGNRVICKSAPLFTSFMSWVPYLPYNTLTGTGISPHLTNSVMENILLFIIHLLNLCISPNIIPNTCPLAESL